MLILYAAAFTGNFLLVLTASVEFTGFFFLFSFDSYMLTCHLPAVSLSFFSSNVDAFNFFFCLIALARTSNTTLNRSGEGNHPCLISDIR